MKTQSISHLLYYPITFYARSSPSNSYLSSPPLRYFPFYPFLAAWNHRYADNHKWRAGRKQGGTSRGWQEGTCAGFVRQHGSNGLALRDWKSCPIYDYILRDNNDSSDYKSNVAHRSRESYDDYKRWYERFRERCNYVFVRITNGWQRIPIEIENLTSPLCDFYIYISSLTFQTVTRGDPLSAKQEFVSSSFSLSTEALRVASAFLCDQACGQAFTAFPSTPSIIFWSRICSILRAKRRSMFRTDFPYVTGNLGQFTIIRGNQGRGEQGRGNGSVKMHGRAVPGFLVRWRQRWETRGQALCCRGRGGNSGAVDEDGDGEEPAELVNADFDAGTSLRSLPSVHHRRIRFEYPNSGPEFVATQPWAALSGHPRIYRIHHYPRNSMVGRFLLGCSIFSEEKIRS